LAAPHQPFLLLSPATFLFSLPVSLLLLGTFY
jgi:hypothetical protein